MSAPLRGTDIVRGKRLNRLLQIIALLRGPTSYNARRLAEHFGVSRRNVHRDMAVLELAGVPFYYDPDYGEGGGYRIRHDWWFPHVGLTDRECLDLAVLARVAEKQSIPLLQQVCSVRDKLLATLPSKQQDVVRTASELFDILGLHLADHSHCLGVMATLQTGLMTGQQLTGLYRSPHKRRAERVSLQPRRVFLAGQAWYLAAFDNRSGEDRLYRLARFKELRMLDKPIDVEPDFSLRDMLGNAWTVFRGDRDWHIEIRFEPVAADLVAETRWHHTQEIERRKNGSATLRFTVSGLEEIKHWVLQWGPAAKVVKPSELADEVKSLAQSTADRYGSRPARAR